MAAADARAAPFRFRAAARGLLHAAQVVALFVLLRGLAESPWVAAAAPSILRVGASLLAPQRIGFIAANVIVIILAALFPSNAASLSTTLEDASGSPSSNPNGDAPRQNPLLGFLVDPPEELMPVTEAEHPPSREEEVFEDKHAVHVKTKVCAQPPRRTMSDKTGGGGGAAGRTATAAAAPELRRAKSENTRRRQRRSAAAAAPAELGTDDAEAFRQVVEAFITKQQTLFHREESLVIARAAARAAAGREDGPAIAGAAGVAVK